MWNTVPEYLSAQIAPVKYVILAYYFSGEPGGQQREALARQLGAAPAPKDAADAWAEYAKAEEALRNRREEDAKAGDTLPLEQVCVAFALSHFEQFALSLTLAVELDGTLQSVVASLFGRVTLRSALQLYAACLDESIGYQVEWAGKHQDLQGVFRAAGPEDALTLQPTIRAFLLGADYLPEGVALFTPGEFLPEPLTDFSASDLIDRQLALKPQGNLFLLTGEKGAGRKYQVKRFAQNQGCRAVFVRAQRLKPDADWVQGLLAVVRLNGALLCICDLPGDALPEEALGILSGGVCGNVFLTGGEIPHTTPEGWTVIPLALPELDEPGRASVWAAYTGRFGLPEEVAQLSVQYRLTVGQIEAACISAQRLAARMGEARISLRHLHHGCRRQITHDLNRLAGLVKTRYTWEDIVLPPMQLALLRHICSQVKHRGLVYGQWGFESKLSYGRGVRALFSGAPGTGKTMAAQVISTELDMELYQVNLSSLVSKYIGDTEKNLDEIFRQAEKSGGILFFDEADALFGKRGEQKDSHDKYANMQTAFLLQQFEAYDGVVLLSTNLISNMDPAFNRRMQNRVEFPAPTAEYRKRIWSSLMLKTAPFQNDIDVGFLAEKFTLTGAAIKNIVLQAAFLAAAAEREIGMEEIIGAIVMEHDKMGKVFSREDFGAYEYCLTQWGR